MILSMMLKSIIRQLKCVTQRLPIWRKMGNESRPLSHPHFCDSVLGADPFNTVNKPYIWTDDVSADCRGGLRYLEKERFSNRQLDANACLQDPEFRLGLADLVEMLWRHVNFLLSDLEELTICLKAFAFSELLDTGKARCELLLLSHRVVAIANSGATPDDVAGITELSRKVLLREWPGNERIGAYAQDQDAQPGAYAKRFAYMKITTFVNNWNATYFLVQSIVELVQFERLQSPLNAISVLEKPSFEKHSGGRIRNGLL